MASRFAVLPAIDLRGGKVVRLQQGDFGRETAFSDDPVAVARHFVETGARWIHVVDLDGARSGEPAHAALIQDIVAAVGDRAVIEVAGGLRTEAAVATVLRSGAGRAVIGTAALRDATFAGRLVATHGPDRIAVALDDSRSQRIHDIQCVHENGRLVISTSDVEDLSLEQVALRQSSSLFEETFGMPVMVRKIRR